MDRPLFSPPLRPVIDAGPLADGSQDVSADALFDQTHVDRERLRANVRRALQTRDQVSLSEVIGAHPIEQGLAELVVYLGVAADDPRHVIDDDRRETVFWTDAEGVTRQATLPLVVFVR
jgi:hypothetical protein